MAADNRSLTNPISPIGTRTAGAAVRRPAPYIVFGDAPCISTTVDDGLDEVSTDKTIKGSAAVGESEPCDNDATNGITRRTEDKRAGITGPWAFTLSNFDEFFARSENEQESSGRADKLGIQTFGHHPSNATLPRLLDHPDNTSDDDGLTDEDAACDRYHWPSVEGTLRDDDARDVKQFHQSQFIPGMSMIEAQRMPPVARPDGVLTRSDSARHIEEARNVLNTGGSGTQPLIATSLKQRVELLRSRLRALQLRLDAMAPTPVKRSACCYCARTVCSAGYMRCSKDWTR